MNGKLMATESDCRYVAGCDGTKSDGWCVANVMAPKNDG
jgi:hypothetical protein